MQGQVSEIDMQGESIDNSRSTKVLLEGIYAELRKINKYLEIIVEEQIDIDELSNIINK